MVRVAVATIGVVIVSGVAVSMVVTCELEAQESGPTVPAPDRLLTGGFDASSDGRSFCG
jgi:hypothetical protein